jgi:hypothetical protein
MFHCVYEKDREKRSKEQVSHTHQNEHKTASSCHKITAQRLKYFGQLLSGAAGSTEQRAARSITETFSCRTFRLLLLMDKLVVAQSKRV